MNSFLVDQLKMKVEFCDDHDESTGRLTWGLLGPPCVVLPDVAMARNAWSLVWSHDLCLDGARESLTLWWCGRWTWTIFFLLLFGRMSRTCSCRSIKRRSRRSWRIGRKCLRTRCVCQEELRGSPLDSCLLSSCAPTAASDVNCSDSLKLLSGPTYALQRWDSIQNVLMRPSFRYYMAKCPRRWSRMMEGGMRACSPLVTFHARGIPRARHCLSGVVVTWTLTHQLRYFVASLLFVIF